MITNVLPRFMQHSIGAYTKMTVKCSKSPIFLSNTIVLYIGAAYKSWACRTPTSEILGVSVHPRHPHWTYDMDRSCSGTRRACASVSAERVAACFNQLPAVTRFTGARIRCEWKSSYRYKALTKVQPDRWTVELLSLACRPTFHSVHWFCGNGIQNRSYVEVPGQTSVVSDATRIRLKSDAVNKMQLQRRHLTKQGRRHKGFNGVDGPPITLTPGSWPPKIWGTSK